MSNTKKNNVIKIKNTDIKINAATVVVALILLYVLICVIRSAKKEPITVYKVNKSNISNNIILDGIALRDERVLNSTETGYICYYVRDEEKIQRNATICTVDKSGEIYDIINEQEEYEELFTKENYSDIRSIISLYKINYNDVEFYNSYAFENNINNKVFDLTNEILMQKTNIDSNLNSSSAMISNFSGIVTYYIDGFEKTDAYSIDMSCFDQSKYKKQTLKSGDSVSVGTPIIKIIPSEDWCIVAPITNEQIAALNEKTKISFYINDSSFTATMPYEIINAADGSYIKINLNKYMTNFVSERYLTVEIVFQDDTGLKIPASSIVDKKVYKVPVSYFSAGGNQSSNNRLNIQVRDEDDQLTIKQISPNIYHTDEEFYYVDPISFADTDVLYNINTNETLPVSLLDSHEIQGVYSVNKGIADFKPITIKKIIDEFALIENDESIKIYDNIVMDASQVTENQIIY